MIIDAHQHVWDLSRAEYPWLDGDLAPINRTMGFAQILPDMRRADVEATVLVQAADNEDDTANMLRVAHANPQVVGVVAWVPLEEPARVVTILERLRRDQHVVGVRTRIHAQSSADWLLRDDIDAGLGVLEALGLPFDFVADEAGALALLPVISARHPELAIVIDHLGKPPVGGPATERFGWRRLIAAACENPRVTAKISGLYSARGKPQDWSIDSVRPFVADAFELFGPDRLMFGSDWPISELAGGYARVWAALSELFSRYDAQARDAVLGGTATSVYHLDPTLLAAAEAAGKENE